MCTGCCRKWNVLATEAELERFIHHDWAAARPRMANRELVEDAGDGLYRLAHTDDEACVFLDDDGLCAIHKELGMEAKPAMCKQFPYNLTDTPEGVVVSLDFACPTVVVDKGAPLETQGDEVQTRIAEWAGMQANSRLGMAGVAPGQHTPRVEARKGVRLEWADYLVLERKLLTVLEDEGRSLTTRLQLVDALASEAAQAKGKLSEWIQTVDPDSFVVESLIKRPSPMAQRALVAPVVSSIEEGWGQDQAKRSSGARVGLALAITSANGSIPLPTADAATLQLPRMLRTEFAQDDPALTEPIGRFMTAFVARKGLVKSTTLLHGARLLALYFGVIRWYSVARAVLADRPAVAPSDVQDALVLVEKTLSRSPGLTDGRFAMLMNFLFDHVCPPRSLYLSTYPS